MVDKCYPFQDDYTVGIFDSDDEDTGEQSKKPCSDEDVDMGNESEEEELMPEKSDKRKLVFFKKYDPKTQKFEIMGDYLLDPECMKDMGQALNDFMCLNMVQDAINEEVKAYFIESFK